MLDLNACHPDVYELDANETTPLIIAASYGYLECVQTLLKLGADPDVKTKDKGITAIGIAEKKGFYKVLFSLVMLALG